MPVMVNPDDGQEEYIVDRIYEAVLDQRLAPGTKLSEANLCTAFGVGRMRIRRTLLILASREVVELQPTGELMSLSPMPNRHGRFLKPACL
jgi:DNA-binding GntR family transcriptional regulator